MKEQQVKKQNKSKSKEKGGQKGKSGVKTKKNFGKKVFKPKPDKNKEEKLVIDKLQAKYEQIDVDKVNTFADLPLSANTLKGLKACDYLKPTDIQKQTIKLALTRKDVLGAAQTGSGKTLAFLIPILERLFTKQWTRLDGIGAVVITPTRELAYQIFNTLQKLALPHKYTTGFVVGGKDLRYEWSQVGQCNIIVCTPGRLLQHMDENSSFDCVNLEVLVLDEADRCLDMGFQQTMNAIIANLPPTRQTLLFSATQTKSVKDLARLSLQNPCYVSVHEHFTYSTPEGLQQNYVLCELKDKVSMLWTFIRNNPQQKIIIFLASCKQVKYLSEIFTRNRVSKIMALYGTLHQMRRLAIYEDFCKKTSAVLFATDIAARGLDFPEVHWVVQGDCPEDAETYIHRVGRTARFHRGGKSLLLLMPSELGMLDALKEKKVPIEKHVMDQSKMLNPVRDMKKYLAQSEELTDTARRAFLSYVKSIVHMKNKKIFDVKALDTDSFAHSLGLMTVPKIRFLKKMMPSKISHNTKISFVGDEAQEKSRPEDELVEEIATKFQKPSASQSTNVLKSFATSRLESDSDDDEEEDELDYAKLNKESHDYLQSESNEILEAAETGANKNKIITKAAAVKKLMKKKIKPNTKIIFNDEGEAVKEGVRSKKSHLAEEYENEVIGGVDIEKSKLVLRAEDKFDKELFKKKVQSKHKEEKHKLKAKKKKEEEERKAQKEQDEQDDFGGDSESGEEPDLSWLPDPDKIYGKSTGDDDDDDDEPAVVSEKREKKKDKKQMKSKKRKLENSNVESLKKKKQKLNEISTSLNVNEAEELAMMLLQKK